MGVTGMLLEIQSDILEKMREAKIYTTYDFLKENPPLKESDIVSEYISIGKNWNEIYIAFSNKDSELKFIIEGDYHHPAGIEEGLDPGSYYYQAFVTPKTVKRIAQLVDSYSRETLLNELNTQKSLYGDVLYHEDITERLLANFRLVFDLYQRASENNNGVQIIIC